jgi:hypothetical protein
MTDTTDPTNDGTDARLDRGDTFTLGVIVGLILALAIAAMFGAAIEPNGAIPL